MNNYDSCIVGYYGMKNSGDDALLAATVWGAENYLDVKKLTVTTPLAIKVNSHHSLQPTLAGRQRFRGQNRLLRYAQAFQSQRLIFGGGSVFHSAQDINIKRHMMTLARGKQHLAVGVGLGPFANTAAERACAQFLRECSFVGLRDQESYDIARSIAPESNSRLTFDLAPLLLCDPAHQLQALPRSGVAVCLCPKERLSGDVASEQRRLQLLAGELTNIYAATGEPVYLVDLNGHELLGDTGVHRELKQLMPGNIPVHLVKYDANPLRVLQRMATFKAVLSMRLHGSVFSFMANTPVVSLNYHRKCKGWCDQIGMPTGFRFETDNFEPFDLAETVIKGIRLGFARNDLSVAEAIDASQKNWRL